MTTSDCFRRTLLAGLGLVATVHRLAEAAPTPNEEHWAECLLAEGRVLRARNDLDGALRRFQAADKLLHAPTTGLEVAQVQGVLGSVIEARQVLRRILETPPSPDDASSANDVRAKAATLDEELKGRVVRLRFQLSGAPAGERASVFIDSNRDPVTINGPVEVNPGKHSIVAKTSTQEVTRTIDARESDNIFIPLSFESAPSRPATELAQGDANASQPRPAARGLPRLAYLGFGVGAAGVVVGGVTGFLAIMAKKAAERGCAASRCPPPSSADDPTQRALAKASTASLMVGAAGVGLAIGSILLQRKNKPTVGSGSSPREIGESIRINPSLGGVGLSGKW